LKVKDSPIIVEQLFHNSVDEVWKAITELDQMKEWFFDNIPDFKPEVGFRTQFNVNAPSRYFMHLWEVTKVMPNKMIVTNWRFEELEGNSLVIFELTSIGNKTKLTVTNKLTQDFDDSIPEFKRESCIGGWNYFIKERLVQFLSS
jgi:uncharacterized protein YndB with AHSA1/START domain